MDHLCYFCLIFCYGSMRLFIDALWSPAENSDLVMSNFEVDTFPLISWVSCGA